jgi:hypothetical protein
MDGLPFVTEQCVCNVANWDNTSMCSRFTFALYWLVNWLLAESAGNKSSTSMKCLHRHIPVVCQPGFLILLDLGFSHEKICSSFASERCWRIRPQAHRRWSTTSRRVCSAEAFGICEQRNRHPGLCGCLNKSFSSSRESQGCSLRENRIFQLVCPFCRTNYCAQVKMLTVIIESVDNFVWTVQWNWDCGDLKNHIISE